MYDVLNDPEKRRVAAHEFGEQPGHEMPTEYWADFRAIRTLTLEDLMREHGFDRIDVLKLDCEGSEFSILQSTPSLNRIGLIVGEYHGKANFERLVAERFAGWKLKILRDGDIGTFWLTNPVYAPQRGSPSREEFRDRLAAVFHPSDLPDRETWLPYYQTLFELVREWMPRREKKRGKEKRKRKEKGESR